MNKTNKENNKPPSKWSSRKGCYWCKQPLKTMKEKVLRSCDNCAKGVIKGANKMSQGKFKDGKNSMMNLIYGNNKEQRTNTENLMKQALNKKRNKIEKQLKKQGLTEEQIKEGLNNFDQSLK